MAPSIQVKGSCKNLSKCGAKYYLGLVKTRKDLDTNAGRVARLASSRKNSGSGLDGLGDRSRVDVDVNDLGIRAELRRAIDHTVIETRTDGQDHIGMVHRQVGGVAAMHAEHADELTVGARVGAQSHQGIGDWQVEH